MMRLLFFATTVWLITGCKEDASHPLGTVHFDVAYLVDGIPLSFDTIQYVSEAGNQYGISRMEYYISALAFLKSGAPLYESGNVQYVSAKAGSTNSFSLDAVPVGNYDCITFLIGLNSVKNVTNELPNTIENINMAWPDAMGGGYHFMKYEGHFLDSLGREMGFAMHLGENANVVEIKITGLDISVAENATVDIALTMNLNEWFKNPSVFDFNADGNYTMGVAAAMQKLAVNGKDVFSATVQ